MSDEFETNKQCCDADDECCKADEIVMESGEGADDVAKQLKEEIALLKQQVESNSKQADEYKDLLQRVQADFDNYRRRNAGAVQDAYKNGMLDAVKQFLPVLDNLERAIKASESSQDFKTLVDGIDMVVKQFHDVMNKMGIEEIEALGKPFDPNLHDAVMSVDKDGDQDSNTVVEVFQKGYKVDDKVLRHSLVKVTN
ncbi:nucleotide exchange factor GrpE [Mahella sp.]|uniref:nucleotide exchange factor GrpE n=1 Tax=Mahella sp. TaxID=2798721 RepID=UPI0025B848A8|nr:nucleotide exchange factor GrpE [Mahella sp.]MBZ4666050.1 GrpE protein [Mahella sp.]MDK2902743.1 molecular chaperone GrpE [Clostridiales bacterium]